MSHMPNYYKSNASESLYSPAIIARSLSADRLGGICLINLTGEGETLLQHDIVEICRLLLEEGHFIEIVTNLTITQPLKSLLQFPVDLQKRIVFKISFHYLELKKRDKLELFWDNVQMVQSSECSFSLELMSDDAQIDYIPMIIDECLHHVGAKPHVTVGRNDNDVHKGLLTRLDKQEYEDIWSGFDSNLFEYKMELFGKRRKEYCYAGKWSLFVNMHTGEARTCYAQPDSQNIFEYPDEPIRFSAVGHHCVQPYCFNGHSFLTLGVIPELDAPSYYNMRNRTRLDGTNWYSEEAKEFYCSKLILSNKVDGFFERIITSMMWYLRLLKYTFTHINKVTSFLKERVLSYRSL